MVFMINSIISENKKSNNNKNEQRAKRNTLVNVCGCQTIEDTEQ